MHLGHVVTKAWFPDQRLLNVQVFAAFIPTTYLCTYACWKEPMNSHRSIAIEVFLRCLALIHTSTLIGGSVAVSNCRTISERKTIFCYCFLQNGKYGSRQWKGQIAMRKGRSTGPRTSFGRDWAWCAGQCKLFGWYILLYCQQSKDNGPVPPGMISSTFPMCSHIVQ